MWFILLYGHKRDEQKKLERPIMTVIHINVPYSMLLQRIDFALQNRIHPEIYFSGDDLDACHENEVKYLAETLMRNGLEITVHGPFMDLSPGGVDRKVKGVTWERFLKTIELAQFFKPKTIVFPPGYEKWKFDGNVSLWLESSLQTWRPLVKQAEEMGLTLAIENVFEETPDSLAALLKEINSPHFRFCFDTGHHHVFSKTPFPKWMEVLGNDLSEVHLHDNHKEMDEHLPIGEGGFDFDGFFNLLSKFGLNPIYTIEPHEEDHLWRGLNAVKKYIDNVKCQNPNAK
jgi:sugar phosphate isomerase/epimerase